MTSEPPQSARPGLCYRLEYELVTDGWRLTFESPPPLEVLQPEFTLRLENGRAIAEMSVRYPTDLEARRVVEPYLRSWEIKTRLELVDAPFAFQFRDARISDRETSRWRPDGWVRVTQVVVEAAIPQPPPLSAYPPPPSDFLADGLVLRMWARRQQYRDGRDGLSAMAYFCLEEVEYVAGGRVQAAALFGISRNVLDSLGKLANRRGTSLDARHRGATPYAPAEQAWVERVIDALIRHAGGRAAGVQPRQLTMADFPPL